MQRVIFLIDGFNLYHAICDSAQCISPRFRGYKWVNLRKLAECYVRSKDKIRGVYYFTALPPWDEAKRDRHKLYIKAQTQYGVKTIFGKFRLITRKCRATCKQEYETYAEKKTDVNISTLLFDLAYHKKCDRFIIISADTDLIPAIQLVQRIFKVEVGVVIPVNKKGKDIAKACDFKYRMKEKHLLSSVLPDSIELKDGIVLTRPPNWA